MTNELISQMKVHLENDAFMPQRAHDADAGADLFTPQKFDIEPNDVVFIDTGVHIDIPRGYVLELKEKSGLARNHGIQILGGVVDAGYTGSIGVIMKNNSKHTVSFDIGDKICQFIVYAIETPRFIISDISDFAKSDRNDQGFGSTNN